MHEGVSEDRRCTAIIRSGPRAGERCLDEQLEDSGTTVCVRHGANLPVVQAKAAERVNEARMKLVMRADSAVETLLELMDSAATDATRLKATTEILDRIGLRGGSEIHVSTDDSKARAAEIIAERLDKLRNGRAPQRSTEPEPVILELEGVPGEPLEGELLPRVIDGE